MTEAPDIDLTVVRLVQRCRRAVILKYQEDFAQRNKLIREKGPLGVMEFGSKRLKKRLKAAADVQKDVREILATETDKKVQKARLKALYRKLTK